MLGYGVKQTTTTTGTGNLTLSSVSGFPTVANAFQVGEPFSYSLLDSSGQPVEAGIGYLSSSTVLVRALPTHTYASSTYDDTNPSAVSLTGTTTVICSVLPNNSAPTMTGIFSSAANAYLFDSSIQFSVDTKLLTADLAYYMAFRCDYMLTVAGMVCNVTTGAGTGSNKIRMAYAAFEPDGSMGAILGETSDGDPSTTGAKTLAFSSATVLKPGWYVVGVISDVAPTLQARRAGSQNAALVPTPFGASSFNNRYSFWTDSIASWTAFTDPFEPASGVAITADYSPQLGFYQ